MGRGDPRPGAGRPLGAVARASIAMFAKKPLGLAKPSGWGFMMRTDNQVLIYLLTALLVSSWSTARAEDNCLLKPEAPAPQGSRWYYRTDPTSQNKCWHLRTEGQTGQQPIQQEKPVRPDQRGKATSPAAADFPLPRSAPKEARQQHSTTKPTGLAASALSDGMVNPGTAQGDVELRGGLGDDTVVPPAPSAKTNVWDDAPTGNVTGSASSSKASDNALAQPRAQLPAAADDEARGEAPPDEKQRVDHLKGQIPENKNNKAENTAGNSKSGAKSSLAVLFIIVAAFIVCGILIYSLLIVRFARRHEAAATGGLGSVLPAQSEKTETNDHTQNALQELIQILGPYEAPRSAAIRQVRN